nr:hypothetical protein BaRGS_000572 [Batillaria attramentaria]
MLDRMATGMSRVKTADIAMDMVRHCVSAEFCGHDPAEERSENVTVVIGRQDHALDTLGSDMQTMAMLMQFLKQNTIKRQHAPQDTPASSDKTCISRTELSGVSIKGT